MPLNIYTRFLKDDRFSVFLLETTVLPVLTLLLKRFIKWLRDLNRKFVLYYCFPSLSKGNIRYTLFCLTLC